MSEQTKQNNTLFPERLAEIRRRALLRLVLVPLILGAIFFGAAGSFNYWQGWLYLAVIGLLGSYFTRYLLKHDPELLDRRMHMKEKLKEQKWIVGLSSLLYLPMLILPGVDYRLGWSQLPPVVSLFAFGVLLLGYSIIVKVFLTNSYASRVIEVVEGQRVIDTGPYRYVRHPMYTGTILMFGATPLALGSLAIVVLVPLLVGTLIFRIRSEERFLEQELEGYSEYLKRTPYRLIPGIW